MPRPLVIRVKESRGGPRLVHVRPGLTFGRARENVCQILDTSVSRSHAVVNLENDRWVLREVAATNPVRLVHNGREMTFGEVTGQALEPGMTFYLGRVSCEVLDPDNVGAMSRTEKFRAVGSEDPTLQADRLAAPGSMRAASGVGFAAAAAVGGQGAFGAVGQNTDGVGPGGLTIGQGMESREVPGGTVAPGSPEAAYDPRGESRARGESGGEPASGARDPVKHLAKALSTARSRRPDAKTLVEDLQRANPKLLLLHDGLERIVVLKELFHRGEGEGYVLTIGRDAEHGDDKGVRVDLEVKHSVISNPHAAILFRWGRFFVLDLQSKNGTYMRGRREGAEFRVLEGAPVLDVNLPVELSSDVHLNFGDTVDALFFTEMEEDGVPVDRTVHARALDVLVSKGKISRRDRREVVKNAAQQGESHVGAVLLRDRKVALRDWFQACQTARVLSVLVSSTPRWLWWAVAGCVSLMVVLLVLLVLLVARGS